MSWLFVIPCVHAKKAWDKNISKTYQLRQGYITRIRQGLSEVYPIYHVTHTSLPIKILSVT